MMMRKRLSGCNETYRLPDGTDIRFKTLEFIPKNLYPNDMAHFWIGTAFVRITKKGRVIIEHNPPPQRFPECLGCRWNRGQTCLVQELDDCPGKQREVKEIKFETTNFIDNLH